MGDDSLPTTTYKVVYILWRHEVTVCKECNESHTESEGLRMHPSANNHPPGLSLGSECFGVLRRVSDLGSNVAGIGSLHQPLDFKAKYVFHVVTKGIMLAFLAVFVFVMLVKLRGCYPYTNSQCTNSIH